MLSYATIQTCKMSIREVFSDVATVYKNSVKESPRLPHLSSKAQLVGFLELTFLKLPGIIPGFFARLCKPEGATCLNTSINVWL